VPDVCPSTFKFVPALPGSDILGKGEGVEPPPPRLPPRQIQSRVVGSSRATGCAGVHRCSISTRRCCRSTDRKHRRLLTISYSTTPRSRLSGTGWLFRPEQNYETIFSRIFTTGTCRFSPGDAKPPGTSKNAAYDLGACDNPLQDNLGLDDPRPDFLYIRHGAVVRNDVARMTSRAPVLVAGPPMTSRTKLLWRHGKVWWRNGGHGAVQRGVSLQNNGRHSSTCSHIVLCMNVV